MKKTSKTKVGQQVIRVKAQGNLKKNPTEVKVVNHVKKVTTVHGTQQFGSKKGMSLILWSVIVFGNVVLTAYFLTVIRQKFNENQIITQVNANCKISQVPFPAVSVCNFNLVSVKESENIAKILEKHNIPKNVTEDFFNSLHYLTSYNRNSRSIRNFTNIMNILKRHYFTMDTIMEEVHQKCGNLFLYCSFNRKEKSCAQIFTLTKTIEGYCCTFNYAGLSGMNNMFYTETDQDFEYYDDSNDDISIIRKPVIRTSESGSSTGLSVILNVDPNDYPSYSKIPYYGAKILISDPYDYPETSIVYRYISLGEWVEIKVEAMLFQSSEELRRVEPEKRSCWFYDEVVLDHTDRYSCETCNAECKMKTYIESCGCLPFYYPRAEKSIRVCELGDLKCLNNVTVFKSINNMNCKYVCYTECRDKRYVITSDLAPFVENEFPHNATQDKNVSELAALQVYYGKSNCNCYKKSLLTDINYFIATYGGVFSLSFGASVLTLFEFSFIFSTATAKSIWRAISNVQKMVYLRRKNL